MNADSQLKLPFKVLHANAHTRTHTQRHRVFGMPTLLWQVSTLWPHVHPWRQANTHGSLWQCYSRCAFLTWANKWKHTHILTLTCTHTHNQTDNLCWVIRAMQQLFLLFWPEQLHKQQQQQQTSKTYTQTEPTKKENIFTNDLCLHSKAAICGSAGMARAFNDKLDFDLHSDGSPY